MKAFLRRATAREFLGFYKEADEGISMPYFLQCMCLYARGNFSILTPGIEGVASFYRNKIRLNQAEYSLFRAYSNMLLADGPLVNYGMQIFDKPLF